MPEIVNSLASYGALGIVAIYFMFKDWKRTSENDVQHQKHHEEYTEALKEFTATVAGFKEFLMRGVNND